jgi:hypothetical protein
MRAGMKRIEPTIRRAAVAAMLLLAGTAHATQTPGTELVLILDRAAEYVAAYEDRELGNVISSETYVQDLFLDRGFRLPFSRQQRRTESDFLIVLVGTDRYGVRIVRNVDGKPVKGESRNLDALMDNSPDGLRKQIAGLNRESSQYNLGPVFGQINLPIFSLKVLRRGQASRFAFEQRGTSRISGIQTVEIRFQERDLPTLIHSDKGNSIMSSGSLWIEPATGRVLKTEMNFANSDTKTKGRVTVTYEADRALGILVPRELKEHYESNEGYADCLATYSRFRSFNVEVKSDVPTRSP